MSIVITALQTRQGGINVPLFAASFVRSQNEHPTAIVTDTTGHPTRQSIGAQRWMNIACFTFAVSVLMAVLSGRCLYADGAHEFIKVLQAQTFVSLMWSRHFAFYFYEFPLVLAIKSGVTDLHLLRFAFGLGCFLPWPVALICCRWLAPCHLWIVALACAAGYLNTAFMAVGEHIVAHAFFWPALFCILFARPLRPLAAAILLASATLLLYSYESQLLLCALLAALCLWRIVEEAGPAAAPLLNSSKARFFALAPRRRSGERVGERGAPINAPPLPRPLLSSEGGEGEGHRITAGSGPRSAYLFQSDRSLSPWLRCKRLLERRLQPAVRSLAPPTLWQRGVLLLAALLFIAGSGIGLYAVLHPELPVNFEGFRANALGLISHLGWTITWTLVFACLMLAVWFSARVWTVLTRPAALAVAGLALVLWGSWPLLMPSQLDTARQYDNRAMDVLVPLLLLPVALILTYRPTWLAPRREQLVRLSAVLLVVQSVWHLCATWQWRQDVARLQTILSSRAGPIPLQSTVLRDDAMESRRGDFDWAWPCLSIAFSPTRSIHGMVCAEPYLDARLRLWQPFQPMKPKTLPELRHFGIDYSNYLSALQAAK